MTLGTRVRDRHAYELQPGEYGNRDVNWYGVTPNGLLCMLTKHTVVEHEDGTISVEPSIACEGTVGDSPTKIRWHGFLRHGVWEDA